MQILALTAGGSAACLREMRVNANSRLYRAEAVAVIAVAEVVGIQTFGDLFGHVTTVAEQRSTVKYLDDIQLFLGHRLRFDFLYLRLVIRHRLKKMSVSCGNNAVVRDGCTNAAE